MTGWLTGRSVEEVRRALADVCPDIAGLPVALHEAWVEQGNPLWDRSSAFVGESWVAKFAWSEPAAQKLEREIAVLRAFAAMRTPPPTRRVHAWSSDPVIFVSPFVAGSPVLGDEVARLDRDTLRHLANEMACVLAELHGHPARIAIDAAGVLLPAPTPQADTYALRSRLAPMLDRRRQALVLRWCDWVDEVLHRADGETVVLHGDFHGFNLVVDETFTIQIVLDVEEASVGDYHYDFRYLPAQSPTLDLFLTTVEAYELITRRSISIDRVMGWHIRTVLGDALWRTEARVALPHGGSCRKWVDELDHRMTELELNQPGHNGR